jgi:hypothetical protein
MSIVADPDQHGSASFWEAGSGSGSAFASKWNLHQSEKQDPDPHQSEKLEAL